MSPELKRTTKIELILCVIALIVLLPVIKIMNNNYEKKCNTNGGEVHLAYAKVKSCIDKDGNKIDLTNK